MVPVVGTTTKKQLSQQSCNSITHIVDLICYECNRIARIVEDKAKKDNTKCTLP